MKVIYYRRADGSIRTFHGAGKIPEYQLPERVKEYNNNSKTDQAFVTDLPEGSLEAHLFQQAQARARLDLDTLTIRYSGSTKSIITYDENGEIVLAIDPDDLDIVIRLEPVDRRLLLPVVVIPRHRDGIGDGYLCAGRQGRVRHDIKGAGKACHGHRDLLVL